MSRAPRAVIFGCYGHELTNTERSFFADADPWGFILFLRNIEGPRQVRKLVAELRDAVGWDAPVLIDQEGGRVQRLLPPAWTGWPSPLDFVSALKPSDRARAMELRYRIIAAELADLGIDVNCAPMADIAQDDTHKIIRNRCYGTDAAEVAALGRAVAQGLLKGGVLPVLKHIPGHGRTPLDSHVDLPVVSADLATLEAEDFAPFRALADLPLAMTAHIVYPALDPAQPATLSRKAVGYIREVIGFDGLLMTDDLSMQALRGRLRERVARAVAAGCDMMLHCNGDFAEMLQVADAAPRLEGDALRRADAALEAKQDPGKTDLAGLKAELSELMAEARHA